MRLDHLLSKEYKPEYGLNSGQQGPFALFDFEDAERNSEFEIRNSELKSNLQMEKKKWKAKFLIPHS